MSENLAQLISLPIGFPNTWVWRYTCLLLLISMLWRRQEIFESKGDKLSSFAECRIRSLEHQFSSRLNAHSQTDWAIEYQAKNLNSTARPYDEWALSPLDFAADWLSHLALAKCMFVVVNLDAMAQASDFLIERRRVVFLAECMIRSLGVSDTNSPADWMPTHKPTELSRIKLNTWTQQLCCLFSRSQI